MCKLHFRNATTVPDSNLYMYSATLTSEFPKGQRSPEFGVVSSCCFAVSTSSVHGSTLHLCRLAVPHAVSGQLNFSKRVDE